MFFFEEFDLPLPLYSRTGSLTPFTPAFFPMTCKTYLTLQNKPLAFRNMIVKEEEGGFERPEVKISSLTQKDFRTKKRTNASLSDWHTFVILNFIII